MAHQMETTTSNCIDSLFDEDTVHGGNADSGYSSHGSLSHVSPMNRDGSLKPSHYLQPIFENVPVKSFSVTSELTPTSQSIRRINEFHITSPLSSLKRSASSLPCTPHKIGTPKKMRMDGPKGRSKGYRNLIDNIHVDENSENRDIANLEFSPIKAVNVLQDRNGKFERKGSFSSTPIYEDSLLKSMSVSKTDFFNTAKHANQNSLVIRKTKSFSPSKKRWLVGRNRQISVEATTPIPEESQCTPVRKSIKRLLSRQDAVERSPVPSTSSLFDISATLESDIELESPVIYKSPPTSPSTETPVKKIRRNLDFNLSQQSPKKELLRLSPKKELLKLSPKKELLKLSPKNELDNIIFSKIPCSPRKLRNPAAVKRSLTSPKAVAVVAKRPQYDLSPLLPKRASYAHRKHFDIVSHLAETTTAIKNIFSHLVPKDICHMYNVCKTWRTIIQNDGFAFSQRNKYLASLIKNKENLQRKPLLKSYSLDALKKSPLKRANSVNQMKNSLKAVSTRSSFDDDTLLLIKENQRRTKCPVCLRPSIISQKKATDPNKINENRIPFQRNINCDNGFFASELKPAIAHSQYEYAKCTKCAFEFCMNCKCEYHGSDKCPVKPFIAPMMDSDDDGVEEDDVKIFYPAGSRSKRNLRRLCSIDKVKFSSLA